MSSFRTLKSALPKDPPGFTLGRVFVFQAILRN
jgi:hypothetical protein